MSPETEELLERSVDFDLACELGRFIDAINERELLKQRGVGYSYKPDSRIFNEAQCRALDVEVMYWHPNRSHHDEVMWLNRHVFTDQVSFTNQVLNAAAVKFYGPSSTLEVAAGRPGGFIDFERFEADAEYASEVCGRIDESKVPLWGKTELRTSLQTASRNYVRGLLGEPDRKMRPSDMVRWISSFRAEGLIDFYLGQPTIERSYNELTRRPGIGAYYGYHFTCNLSRNSLLQMDENEDFCVPGPGACATLKDLFPGVSDKLNLEKILYLKKNQERVFSYDPRWEDAFEDNAFHPVPGSKRLTTFGVEIACCQFNVFRRFTENPELINKRKILDPRLVQERSRSSGMSEFFG